MHFRQFLPIKLALRRTKRNNLHSRMFIIVVKVSKKTLMNEKWPLVFGEARFAFREKAAQFRFLDSLLLKV